MVVFCTSIITWTLDSWTPTHTIKLLPPSCLPQTRLLLLLRAADLLNTKLRKLRSVLRKPTRHPELLLNATFLLLFPEELSWPGAHTEAFPNQKEKKTKHKNPAASQPASQGCQPGTPLSASPPCPPYLSLQQERKGCSSSAESAAKRILLMANPYGALH